LVESRGVIDEKDNNDDRLRDTQLRFLYRPKNVCKSYLTFTLALNQKFESNIFHIKKNINPLITI
jgi:hypothetical protein